MRARNWTSNLRSRSKTCPDDHKTIESAERKECYYPSGEEGSSEVLASVGLPPVTAEQTTLYRSLVMRAQFLAQGGADPSCEKSDEKGGSTE